jgi:hypothetical protein
MAPALTEIPPPPQSTHPLTKRVSLSIFPDGIKTSGQHPPLYDLLRPFSDFPKEITGPTVWKAEDYKDNPEKWTHRFTEDEISELSEAADQFIAAGIPLTGITKVQHNNSQRYIMTILLTAT